MENLLRIYIERALREPEILKVPGSGPVVTISREYGCPSKPIGQSLTETLNKIPREAHLSKWRFINKEVVESAAQELNLQTNDLNYFMSGVGKGFLEDIMVSFTSGYVSNPRIRHTITNIVMAMAQHGYFVIAGRGSVGVLYRKPNTLHVRLQAPLEWRIPEICKLLQVNEKEAVKIAYDTDKKRMALIELMSGHKYNPYLFDLIINCSTLGQQEIVETIIGTMQAKKMI
ncbi:MAG: cytidylate kinase-like family protein [Bacteroidales bacterium]|nr:cytidylate kinase-like family protein [Bacteroidales bacterium]MDD4602343.1 cytidylate kinase-like family protein [Bacteroidales bacterium]